MNHYSILMQFLRERSTFLEDISNRKRIEQKIFALLVCSSIFFAIYGAIIGSFHGGLQMFSSAIKLPSLYLLTLLICLPALFFFDVVLGSKHSLGQYLVLLLASISLISVMLFGFAPITLFFRLSIDDYNFFTLLNVAVFTVTGLIGVNFFYRSMIFLNNKQEEQREKSRIILKSWLVLYGFVGSQLGWTLRPFFGSPGKSFELFRDIESNFYIQIVKMFFGLFGFN
ncbi:MAG: actin-binding WH2 domain-containing protein [Prochloraceae cyanobacterium]|nr:actin-binding WH2 domain-containing protein [Prochloraceae cyanobacterium]